MQSQRSNQPVAAKRIKLNHAVWQYKSVCYLNLANS